MSGKRSWLPPPPLSHVDSVDEADDQRDKRVDSGRATALHDNGSGPGSSSLPLQPSTSASPSAQRPPRKSRSDSVTEFVVGVGMSAVGVITDFETPTPPSSSRGFPSDAEMQHLLASAALASSSASEASEQSMKSSLSPTDKAQQSPLLTSADAAAGLATQQRQQQQHQQSMPTIKSQVELTSIGSSRSSEGIVSVDDLEVRPFHSSQGGGLFNRYPRQSSPAFNSQGKHTKSSAEASQLLVQSGSSNSSSSVSSAYTSNTLLVLGFNITNLPRHKQYLVCAGGVFFFTLIYGFFQELVVVKIFDRQLSLFLALCQFAGE